MKHKWHKEIKAWASGATIQFWGFEEWVDVEEGKAPEWNEFSLYRIKPEQKEPKYLYVFCDHKGEQVFRTHTGQNKQDTYIGKIKLEDEIE
jgi:hypothetical protein